MHEFTDVELVEEAGFKPQRAGSQACILYIVVQGLVLRIMVIVKEILIMVMMTVDELLMPMMEEDKHVMLNIGCQQKLKSCLRQPLGIYARTFLNWVKRGRKTHPGCGWQDLLDWSFRANTKEKASRALAFIFLCLLTVGVTRPLDYGSCHHDFPTMTDCALEL